MQYTKENEANPGIPTNSPQIKDKRHTVRRASRAVTTQRQTRFPSSSQKQASTPSTTKQQRTQHNASANPQKTRDQLLAEWKAKKGKTTKRSTTTTRSNPPVPSNTQKLANKQTYAALVKMKMKTAKDIALRGSIKDLASAQEKLSSLVDKDPLVIYRRKEQNHYSETKRECESELTDIFEKNSALFQLSEYWCTRAFIAWTTGDLESAVFLLELAQRAKSQPLHPILESIQFILQKVKKEASILFTDSSKSLFASNTEILITAIERLQNFSLVSCVAIEKLKALRDELIAFTERSQTDQLLVDNTLELNPDDKHEMEDNDSSSPQREDGFTESPEDCSDSATHSSSQSYSNSSQIEEDSKSEVDVSDNENVEEELPVGLSYTKEQLPEVQIRVDVNEMNRVLAHLSLSGACVNPSATNEETSSDHHDKDAEIVTEASSSEDIHESEIIDFGESSKENPMEEIEAVSEKPLENTDSSGDTHCSYKCEETSHDNVESPMAIEEEDATETESDCSVEIELSISFSDGDCDEEAATDFNLEVTNDTTTSPRSFQSITQIKQPLSPETSIHSPQLLPNPIFLPDTIDTENGTPSPDIPIHTGTLATRRTKPGTTPIRVNTPLMKKLRQKKRSSIFQPSPSPYIRSSKPERVDRNTYIKSMKKVPKSPQVRDALAIYRRESVLYKASINDMVNDLFGDEELDDDLITNTDIDVCASPTPPNSPPKQIIPEPKTKKKLPKHKKETKKKEQPAPEKRKTKIAIAEPVGESQANSSKKPVQPVRRSTRKRRQTTMYE